MRSPGTSFNRTEFGDEEEGERQIVSLPPGGGGGERRGSFFFVSPSDDVDFETPNLPEDSSCRVSQSATSSRTDFFEPILWNSSSSRKFDCKNAVPS